MAATSHSLYFNRYQKGILGLSGSVGDHTERAEIAKIHAIDSYDMPPHFPSIRQSLDTQLASTRAHHYAMIVTFIQSMQKAGRPCLILVKTISDEQEINSVGLSAHLTQRGLTHQVLNGEQNESADYMISKMGHPKMITIATNLAGRGTNPKLHPDSMQAGGLGMRFTFYPHNTRVKTQGFGRAGRQGQPGCSGMILGMDDPYFKEHEHLIDFKPIKDSQGLYKNEDIKRFMNHIDAIQAAQIAKQSQQRIDFFTRQQPFDQKLQWFFQKNAAVHQLFAIPEFAQQAIELIDSCVFHPTLTSTKRREPWLHELRDKALTLHQQSSGKIGQVFYPLFKHAYLAEIQYIWALFYDSLALDMSEEDELRAYKKVTMQLDSYVNNPAERALSLIAEIADGLSQTLEPVV